MCHLRFLTGPDNKLRWIREIAARDIGRRICLGPCNDIKNLVAKFRQTVGHRKDIVVCAGNPDGAIVLQFLPAQRQPLHVKGINLLLRHAFIPVAFIHTNHLAVLYADATTRQEIWRVGKYHVELEVELRKQLKCIAMKQVEVVVGRFIISVNHYFKPSINSVIFVRLYTLGIVLYASSSLLRADTHPTPSVIHTNS